MFETLEYCLYLKCFSILYYCSYFEYSQYFGRSISAVGTAAYTTVPVLAVFQVFILPGAVVLAVFSGFRTRTARYCGYKQYTEYFTRMLKYFRVPLWILLSTRSI